MVRISKTKIVHEDEIFEPNEIEEINLNEIYFENCFATFESQNEFLAKMQLIKNSNVCPNCFPVRNLNYVRNSASPDKYSWVCTRPCTYTCSLRKGSYFFNSKLSMKSIFKIFYKYIKGDEINVIAHDINVDRDSVSKWCCFLREVICCYVVENNTRIGGFDSNGCSKVVEIDESLFFSRKYNRGRLINGQWYVGGVERGSKNCFIVGVENRNTATMVRVISENVLPGTKVITDNWRAYGRALSEIGSMEHNTINHSICFVDPLNPEVHTQTIESLWSQTKKFVRSKNGISKEMHSDFIIQFIWQYKTEKSKRINYVLILLNTEH